MPSKPLGPESNRIAIDRIEVDRSSRREVGEWGVRRFGRFALGFAALLIFASVSTWCGEPVVGQTGTPNPAEPMPGGAATGDPLAAGDDPNVAPAGAVDLQERQQRVAENYRLLEQKLFDLHEFERDQNPERSDLLRRAFEQSQQRLTGKTLETVARMIADSRLRPAEQNQTLALEDLRALLVLLESEDRDKKLREKEARIKQYIEEVDRLLKIQRGLRSQTENGVDPDRVERAEEDLADRTGNLERQFGETDG
ncbi:MAG TPA: hypothetical protein DCQ98_13170, partial [Planctomycetaceae bacterium]|nr:hypothetical protein [Planctomycetaceae bacterium]